MNEYIKFLGKEIDDLDRVLIEALAKRMSLVKIIELEKRKQDMPIIRRDIEAQRIENCVLLAEELGMSKDFIRSVFYQIHGESIKIQLTERERTPLKV